MKSLVIALLTGSVSSKYLNRPSIWDGESIEAANSNDICSDPSTRWNDASNSWEVYAGALSSTNIYQDNFFNADMSQVYSSWYPPTGDAGSTQRSGGTDKVSAYNSAVKSWMRIKDFYPNDGDPTLYGQYTSARPLGIKQGFIGDCWFLAGVCAIAEQPARLGVHVIHQNSFDAYNWQGIFRYYFWTYDKWVAINIDDRLPTRYKYSNSVTDFLPYSADRSTHGAWWMPLLEKAFAKLNGNYDRIESGNGADAMRQLSNKPVFYIMHNKLKQKHYYDEDSLFAFFHKMHQQNHPMTNGCCNQNPAPDGLIGGHAYTLLDTIIIDGNKLAKIRNPWSSEKYNGLWSDSDTYNWTEARLAQAGHTLGDDGVFFMPFSNYIGSAYFYATAVTIYKDFPIKNMYQEISQTTEVMSIRFTVPSSQVIYITFERPNPRFQKYCTTNRMSLNFYLYKGSGPFPGMHALEADLGNISGDDFHTTLGLPDKVYAAGTYTVMVKNWSFADFPTAKYMLTVYQEGYDQVAVSY